MRGRSRFVSGNRDKSKTDPLMPSRITRSKSVDTRYSLTNAQLESPNERPNTKKLKLTIPEAATEDSKLSSSNVRSFSSSGRSSLAFSAEHVKSVLQSCIHRLKLSGACTTELPEELLQYIQHSKVIPKEHRQKLLNSTQLYLSSCQNLKHSHNIRSQLAESYLVNSMPQALLKKFESVIDKGFESSRKTSAEIKMTKQMISEIMSTEESNVDSIKESPSTSTATIPNKPKLKHKQPRPLKMPYFDVDAKTDPICICRYPSSGIMIACDNPSCPIEWFHVVCVKQGRVPRGDWICAICRADRIIQLDDDNYQEASYSTEL